MQFSREDVQNFPKRHDTFIGIDSDGCVIDSMRIKQREHIQKAIIRYWHLEPLSETLLACSEFVNMTSATRGVNRMKALLLTLDYFNTHPQTRAAGFPVIPLDDLRAYCQSGLPLGTPSLTQWLTTHPSAELEKILRWNNEINRELVEVMRPLPAFAQAAAALAVMHEQSDLMVVSQAPESSLINEWRSVDLLRYVPIIAGQEIGSKVEQLSLPTAGRYAPDRIMMIGDAFGDLDAARQLGIRFYPILPDREEASWQHFLQTIYPKFLSGSYSLADEAELIHTFQTTLPAQPSWR